MAMTDAARAERTKVRKAELASRDAARKQEAAKLRQQDRQRTAQLEAAGSLIEQMSLVEAGQPVTQRWVRQQLGSLAVVAIKAGDLMTVRAILEGIGKTALPDDLGAGETREQQVEFLMQAAEALGLKVVEG